MKFEFLKSNKGYQFSGIFHIFPKIFEDSRGFFYESWNQDEFNKLVNKEVNFVQDNHSKSKKGVLRGLHYQLPKKTQGKLVRCSSGKVFDVFVDLRKNMNTFGQWGGVELNSDQKNLIWIPEGFAHGFLTISQFAELQYKTTNFWSSAHEKSILWNDSYINISWPLTKLGLEKPNLSYKDSSAETLKIKIEKGEIF